MFQLFSKMADRIDGEIDILDNEDKIYQLTKSMFLISVIITLQRATKKFLSIDKENNHTYELE